MPKYCNICKDNHRTEDSADCTRKLKLKLCTQTRITRQCVENMAKAPDSDDMAELPSKITSMSLSERERLAKGEIEQLEQEQRMEELEEKLDKLYIPIYSYKYLYILDDYAISFM